MNEKAIGIFEQYDLKVDSAFKYRGNYGCYTATGKYILMEYDFSEEKLETIFTVQEYLEQGGIKTEKLIHNKENRIISVGEDGFGYVLKKIYDVEECDIRRREHLEKAAKNLGKIHKHCREMATIWDETVRIYPAKNMLDAFRKHNKEILHIKNYIGKRKNKNYFERYLQGIIEAYWNQGKETVTLLEQSAYEELYRNAICQKQILHGNYNQHAIGFEQQNPVLVHLSKVYYGPRIQDVYDFLRKVLEKNNWNIALGHEVLGHYETENPLKKEEYTVLKALFSYPEKFWKIVNYYYNSNKSWYSEKNEEKLKAFQEQEGFRREFIASL
jgi:CotS family spore coat protein